MPHRDAALQQKGADLIDDAGALPDQSFANAMQRLSSKASIGGHVTLIADFINTIGQIPTSARSL